MFVLIPFAILTLIILFSWGLLHLNANGLPNQQ